MTKDSAIYPESFRMFVASLLMLVGFGVLSFLLWIRWEVFLWIGVAGISFLAFNSLTILHGISRVSLGDGYIEIAYIWPFRKSRRLESPEIEKVDAVRDGSGRIREIIITCFRKPSIHVHLYGVKKGQQLAGLLLPMFPSEKSSDSAADIKVSG